MYNETYAYYSSHEFINTGGLLNDLKIRIIDLTNCGYTTDNSYDYRNLRTRVSDYRDIFRQAYRR